MACSDGATSLLIPLTLGFLYHDPQFLYHKPGADQPCSVCSVPFRELEGNLKNKSNKIYLGNFFISLD
jgi:hypothetical protein